QVWNASTTSTTSRSVTIAPYSASRSLVSAAAQIGGAGNSVWRTELTLFNASSTAAATGQFLFIPGAGGTVVTQPLYLAPQQSAATRARSASTPRWSTTRRRTPSTSRASPPPPRRAP